MGWLLVGAVAAGALACRCCVGHARPGVRKKQVWREQLRSRYKLAVVLVSPIDETFRDKFQAVISSCFLQFTIRETDKRRGGDASQNGSRYEIR